MIITKTSKYIKTSFKDEKEIEDIVIKNYSFLFGPSSIFLPKISIKTEDGKATIPDGFAIDFEEKIWYLVEAELIRHDVWNHIAPQITKQLIAAETLATKRQIEDLAISIIEHDDAAKEILDDLEIQQLHVRKVLQQILDKEPLVGIPIDESSNDLKAWTNRLKNKVRIWVISKYVNFNDSSDIVYEFPEEFRPDFEPIEKTEDIETKREIKTYDVSLVDLIDAGLVKIGQKLLMPYKPRNGEQKTYEATIKGDGQIEVLGQIFSSPSYAAQKCITNAGSSRQSINGWTSWKTETGETLADIRTVYLEQEE